MSDSIADCGMRIAECGMQSESTLWIGDFGFRIGYLGGEEAFTTTTWRSRNKKGTAAMVLRLEEPSGNSPVRKGGDLRKQKHQSYEGATPMCRSFGPSNHLFFVM